MGFELDIFGDDQLEAEYIEWLVDEQSVDVRGHFEKFWEYYANPRMEMAGTGTREQKVSESGRCYVQAQEYGLPVRITGLIHSGQAGVFGARSARDVQRKEQDDGRTADQRRGFESIAIHILQCELGELAAHHQVDAVEAAKPRIPEDVHQEDQRACKGN